MLEMIKSTFAQIIAFYSQYVGNGKYMLLLYISLIYLYITEQKKNNRALLLHFPLLMIAIIFNPLVVQEIITIMESDVFWRVFWILPITIIIAYAATNSVLFRSEKSEKIVVAVALITVLIIAGKFIYTTSNFTTASNWYKLPPQTIEVCDILEKECDGEIRAVVPGEFIVSIRQYDANIQMVYGRNGYVNYYDSTYQDRNTLYTLMQESTFNVDSISKLMIKFECNYIVINKTTFLPDSFANYGYHCVASTENYNIYWFSSKEMTLTLS